MNSADSIDDLLPYVRIGDAFKVGVDWSRDHLSAVFDGIASAVDSLVEPLVDLLTAPPAIVMVLIFAGLGWWLRGWKFGLGTTLGLGLVAGLPIWEQTMSTLALVLVASGIALLLAVPLGILVAESRRVSAVVRPVLDLMQTMPAFVYLIPAIFYFGVGAVPGVLATVVFSMPPGVRLTELGLRQVDREVIEAGEAFGASPWKILLRTKLPLALPTIMTGVNQVIMLALSMVVIAGMVGAGGLGEVIMTALARVQVGAGFEGGIAVVILAVVLDRLTDSIGARTASAKAQRAMQQA
ncbi:ABC transporter permease [Verrucosispora sp. WMMD703]|uniref:Glycine/betaine ABC transporter permease n=1 Tax=Micromonospora sediminimaris TaxID=547162 RepID=A0A9W5ULY5_9ACTN|nr:MULTISPECIES: proline/glycine betaine ABC transporter permease [Micromonospora]MBQ1051398.1 proline/glycine betaine ABC transporter permease [Micromonospora sp. C51]GIJ31732.1 glycine/betaine ABC transporter permease [Micromonospora sediminimaris]SFB78454.1 glycine betaine/proline transport system permease protein/glycine betaine/proline transport system substrate-binding protein [Micromonospora sediminimaris]